MAASNRAMCGTGGQSVVLVIPAGAEAFFQQGAGLLLELPGRAVQADPGDAAEVGRAGEPDQARLVEGVVAEVERVQAGEGGRAGEDGGGVGRELALAEVEAAEAVG